VPRTLSISNQLLSIRGRMQITDQSGQPVYEARGSFALIRPTWRISKASREVATVRRQIVSWTSTWKIQSELGNFSIRRKLLSWRPQYKTRGGPFDGAVLKANIWDLKFTVSYRESLMARAAGSLLTLRDRQTIEVLLDGDAPELFVVIVMVALHLDHRDEKGRRKRAENKKDDL
jgi:uncharacterized protein YxjI